MGRLPDPQQQAKGYPAKRKSKADRSAEEIARVAELLAAAPPGSTDQLAPPMLHDDLFRPALAVWREIAPELIRTHRLPRESRTLFVYFCVYAAEWLAAELEIATNGYWQNVKTVSGSFMERKRPVADRRERAFDNVVTLSAKFGLTPHDVYGLFKDQAAAAQQNPGLFDQMGARATSTPQPSAIDPVPAAAQSIGVIGAGARLRSEPPSTLVN